MHKNHAQTLYDDDYAAYCSKRADHFLESLPDEYPDMSSGEHSEEIGSLLQRMGASYQQATETLSQLEVCDTDEQAADLLRINLGELEKTSSKSLRDVVGKTLFDDSAELRAFREVVKYNLDTSLKQQGIQSLSNFEPALFIDRDACSEVSIKGGKNIVDLIDGTYGDVLDYQQMEISRNENEPCLRAYLHNDLHGFKENIIIVPKEFAREAYSFNKEIRKAINESLLSPESEEILDFLKETQAIPELEKDPSTFGIVRGIYSLSEDVSPRALEDLSIQVANFDKKDFEAVYAGNYPDTFSNPYDLESNTYDCSYSYFIENDPSPHTKADDVSRGICKLLQEGNLDKLQETIGGYLRGEREATKSLQKVGKSQGYSR